MTLSVQGCPVCGQSHDRVVFTPSNCGPSPNHTHRAECPAMIGWMSRVFWMDTRKNAGVWERMLKSAGVSDAG